jgi:hypothetical protein
MKLYKKIALTLSVIIASSCTLDLREDPNAVQPDQVLPSLLLNTMQRNVAGLFNGASGTGMSMTRLQNAGSAQYRTAVTPEGFNGIWSTAYAGIMQDGVSLINTADAEGYARHAGIARILQAYTIITLVDFFGSVPYSEAFQGSANFNPALDDEAALYDLALGMLNQAKLDLSTALTTNNPPGYLNPVAPAINDLYYSNNYTRWIKLANTLKLKIYLNLRLTQAATATAEINALIADVSATGGLINAANENFVFRYGTTTSDPDARHPNFVGQYPAGGGAYQSNWLMWHMFHGYDATQTGVAGDPRMRFYFYRQTTANSTSSNEIRCLTESLPNHYPSSTGVAILDAAGGRPPLGVAPTHPTNDATDPAWTRTFCYPTNSGYWGRDHVDPQGIPPDGLLRTAWGAYPVGGRFDNNAGAGVAAAQGMRGAGFAPVMMRSYVQFMLAESALFLGTTGSARTYYQNGINYSMTDVRDWAVAGTYGSSSIAAAPNEATAINAFYPANYLGTFTTAVRVATTANLTFPITGNPTIDGVVTVDGDRVLVKNQTTTNQNGIYVVNAAGWTRAADADAGTELVNMAVQATEGTAGTGRRWFQATTGTITLGTTAIVWNTNNISYSVDVTNYVNAALAAYDNRIAVNATEAMNYVAREYWIASFGNGIEAYNLYRRTGLPTGMQPVINPQPGEFPSSFWYPANAANLNSSITQKSDLTTKVFWDNTTTNLNF